MSNAEVEGLNWSSERMIPAFQAPEHLDIYDIRGASREAQLTITTVVGLINRPQPKIYLILGNDEVFWLKEVFGSIPQTPSQASGDKALEALLTSYADLVQGLVVYDPNLDDSINIATMIAAQRDGIVVSPAQAQALQSRYNLAVLVDLSVYDWTSRLQAYSWALQHLRSGCSSRLVAGIDSKNIQLRPFLVATRAFIYNLDSRNYLPNLSDGLVSERSLMQQILHSYQPGAVHLGWFRDESSGVKLTSQVAMSVLASDMFANLEVWTAVQPASSTSSVAMHSQNSETLAAPGNKVYVSFTISDGDNLQYCQHRMKNIWGDAVRGSLPIGWTLSPSLLHVAPSLAQYYLSSATPQDEFIAGPSGAGYMFPSHWPAEQLAPFLEKTAQQMQTMDMTTLQVLDTNFWQSSGLPLLSRLSQTLNGMVFCNTNRQQAFAQVLRPHGMRGVLSGAGLSKMDWGMVDGVPLYQNLGLAGSVGKTIKLIKSAVARHSQRPLFLNVYILAWSMTPSDLKKVVQQLGSDYEIVLPGTLLAMLAETYA